MHQPASRLLSLPSELLAPIFVDATTGSLSTFLSLLRVSRLTRDILLNTCALAPSLDLLRSNRGVRLLAAGSDGESDTDSSIRIGRSKSSPVTATRDFYPQEVTSAFVSRLIIDSDEEWALFNRLLRYGAGGGWERVRWCAGKEKEEEDLNSRKPGPMDWLGQMLREEVRYVFLSRPVRDETRARNGEEDEEAKVDYLLDGDLERGWDPRPLLHLCPNLASIHYDALAEIPQPPSTALVHSGSPPPPPPLSHYMSLASSYSRTFRLLSPSPSSVSPVQRTAGRIPWPARGWRREMQELVLVAPPEHLNLVALVGETLKEVRSLHVVGAKLSESFAQVFQDHVETVWIDAGDGDEQPSASSSPSSSGIEENTWVADPAGRTMTAGLSYAHHHRLRHGLPTPPLSVFATPVGSRPATPNPASAGTGQQPQRPSEPLRFSTRGLLPPSPPRTPSPPSPQSAASAATAPHRKTHRASRTHLRTLLLTLPVYVPNHTTVPGSLPSALCTLLSSNRTTLERVEVRMGSVAEAKWLREALREIARRRGGGRTQRTSGGARDVDGAGTGAGAGGWSWPTSFGEMGANEEGDEQYDGPEGWLKTGRLRVGVLGEEVVCEDQAGDAGDGGNGGEGGGAGSSKAWVRVEGMGLDRWRSERAFEEWLGGGGQRNVC